MTVDEHPTLRERQAQQVNDEIRRAYVHLINDKGPNGFSLHDVAVEAGVSDRTLYRYYPNREALAQGVHENENAELSRRLDLARQFADLSDPEAVARTFEVFEEHADLVRAASRLRDAGIGDDGHAQRTGLIREIIRDSEVPADAVEQLLGLIRTISSSDGWLRMTRGPIELSSREAGYAVQWAMQVLIAAAKEEDGPLRPEDGGFREPDRNRT